MDMSPVLMDPEVGYTAFTVQRTTYRRQNGDSVPTVQSMTGAGDIHPGTPEMIQLLPEEDRHEEFIAIYTDFPLSAGENNGGATYTTPDRIIWQDKLWRVVRVRDWSTFNYYQCLAVRLRE